MRAAPADMSTVSSRGSERRPSTDAQRDSSHTGLQSPDPGHAVGQNAPQRPPATAHPGTATSSTDKTLFLTLTFEGRRGHAATLLE